MGKLISFRDNAASKTAVSSNSVLVKNLLISFIALRAPLTRVENDLPIET